MTRARESGPSAKLPAPPIDKASPGERESGSNAAATKQAGGSEVERPASGDGPLHDIVLGAVRRSPSRLALHGAALAAVLHVGGVALAIGLGNPPAEARSQRESRPMVVFEHVVELEPPEPAAPAVAAPPSPPPPAPPPAPPVAKSVSRPKPKPTPEPAIAESPPPEAAPAPEEPNAAPPPAAQTGQVVAAAADAPSPPSFAVATGAGSAYAGGTSSSQGSGKQANHSGQVGVGDGASRARAAQLRTRNPPCGWPPEAEDSDLDEAFVTVRATVQPDGSASAVELLSDPGHGFGKRIQWCIRTKMRFEPALDGAGKPVAGSTQPFRVRFVRDE